MAEMYHVVFKGEIIKGANLDSVKRNLGSLFKISGPKLEKLFSGAAVVLKKNLDFENAMKYRTALKKAGAIVDLKEIQIQANVPPKATPGRAVFGERPSAAAPETPPLPEVTESAPKTASNPQAKTAATNGVEGAIAAQVQVPIPSSVRVAEAGERLCESEPSPVADIDTSAISMRAGEGNLVDENERVHVDPVNVDTSAIALSPTGGDLLTEVEKTPFVPVNVDTSGISVADVGTDLVDSKKTPPVAAPDTSHIQLEE